MAKDKKVDKRLSVSRHKRQMMRLTVKEKAEAIQEVERRIQDVEVDPFTTYYGRFQLLSPPYSFERLYSIYEQSDILQTCIDAMQKNVDGFGYKLQFLGDDKTEIDLPEAKTNKLALTSMFDQINETQSFQTIRKRMREDYECLGNGAFEVIRNIKGDVTMAYYAPFKNIRIGARKTPLVTVPVSVMRNGKLVTIKVRKRFRKFAQLDSHGKTLTWFKEFGDPRPMSALTGEYLGEKNKSKKRATEIWHFKDPFGGSPYGLPRWIGSVLQVLGRRAAQYVNHDLFENQGIPPMAVMVSGGALTDDSLDELETIIQGLRGVENWNRILILESNVEGGGLEDKGTAKIELKNLTDYRADDLMFGKYLVTTEKDIRHNYRLPDLYVGQSETFTHATAKAAQTVAEEQVFIPERIDFDEKVNIELIQTVMDIRDWKYVSRGPRLTGATDISQGVKTFAAAGAFTINHAIEQANEAFGLEMSKYTEKWADYPIALVLELVKQGTLKDVGEIQDAAKLVADSMPKASGQKLLPAPTAKMLKSDVFTEDEQSLYKLLITIQNAVEKGVFTCNVPELPDNNTSE